MATVITRLKLFIFSLCQNKLAYHNHMLVFRPKHIHGHWLEIKVFHETVNVKTAPIGNVNSIHEPFFLLEHEEIKAMKPLSWLRVGWVVF